MIKWEVFLSVLSGIYGVAIFIITIVLKDKENKKKEDTDRAKLERAEILNSIEKVSKKIETVQNSIGEMLLKTKENEMNINSLSVYVKQLDKDFKVVERTQLRCQVCQNNQQ